MCCDNHCLKLCLKPCQESIIFNAHLEANTDYVWIVTDSRGNEYAIEFTTDAEGVGALLASELPESLFCEVTAGIKVQVKKTVDDAEFTPMHITQSFSCIELTFTGTAEKVGIE